ncbi:MAG: response regulator [Bacteroidia bacterium]
MKKILLIDDNEFYVHGLKALLLKRHDIKILSVCSSGKQALEILKYLDKKINTILINVSMRRSDELSIARKIKTEYSHIKLIVNSVYPKNICEEICKEIGADDYICKLEDFDAFLSVVLK